MRYRIGAVRNSWISAVSQRPRARRARTTASAFLAVALLGCAAPTAQVDEPVTSYRDRMLLRLQREREAAAASETELDLALRRSSSEPTIQLAGAQTPQTARKSLLTMPKVENPPAPAEVLAQIPDPRHAGEYFARRLAETERDARRGEVRTINQYKLVVQKANDYLGRLSRPNRIELSLSDCVRRALDNSYSIRVAAYNPAIGDTELVEAEAAFDAIFFLDYSFANLDPAHFPDIATITQQTETQSYRGGFRKLLPSGMQVETSVSQSGTVSAAQTVQKNPFNPVENSTFNVSLTQPLLKGFGLDYNRAGIDIARASQRIDAEQFLQQVRDTLLNVEQAYWQLVAARRQVMILAESVGQNWATYKSMEDRLGHDATPVEFNNARSRWRSREVDFIETVKQVRDAEDVLKNLLNDPDLLLSDSIELLPTETPSIAPFGVDHFAEARTAIENRSEIRAAKHAIEQTRIQTARAKNELLPQLDLSFVYQVEGQGSNADDSFDRLTSNRWISYTVNVVFSYPIGNRAPEAAYRRARMQESQAVVSLQRVMDGVIQEVNAAVRDIILRYEQIPSQLDSVTSAWNNLNALQARTPQVNPTYLETELNTVEQVAQTRTRLLQVVTEYNIAIASLEAAKGTLLEYDNVNVVDVARGR